MELQHDEVESLNWRYAQAYNLSATLFYRLYSGVDTEDEAERNHRMYGYSWNYVNDLRIEDKDDNGGFVDQIEVTEYCKRCKGCRSTQLLEYQDASFVVFSQLEESFLGYETLMFHPVCHESVVETISQPRFTGFQFLEQRRVVERKSQTRFLVQDNLVGEHFGKYSVLTGQSWLPRFRREATQNCPGCGEAGSFVCPSCSEFFRECNKCGFSPYWRQVREVNEPLTSYTLDLAGWNGEDVANTIHGPVVSGAVIEALLEAGHTCFAYEPFSCALDKLPPQLLSQAHEKSRQFNCPRQS